MKLLIEKFTKICFLYEIFTFAISFALIDFLMFNKNNIFGEYGDVNRFVFGFELSHIILGKLTEDYIRIQIPYFKSLQLLQTLKIKVLLESVKINKAVIPNF